MQRNKIFSLAIAVALVTSSGAQATICSTSGGGHVLSNTQIAALVGTRYVWDIASPNSNWNEYHTGSSSASSGFVDDYKKGPPGTGNVDPCDGGSTCKGTSGTTGSYAITGTTTGVIKYTYGANSYSYNIYYGGSGNGTGSCSNSTTCATGTYTFCNGTTLQKILNVSTAHG